MADSTHDNLLELGVSASGGDPPGKVITGNLKDEFVHAQAELKKEKSNWLLLKVLHTSVHGVLENARLGDQQALENHQVTQLFERIIQAESQYCFCNALTPPRKATSTVADESEKALRCLVEKDIMKTCEELLEYHDALKSIERSSSTVLAARTVKLGEIIKEEKRKLELSYKELSDAQGTEKSLFSSCMKELLQCSEALSKVITKYKMKLQPKVDSDKLSNLVSRCEALGLKAASMTSKLQKELYTADNVIELQSVRSELSRCKKRKQQEIIAIEQQLLDFKILGDDFNAIVNEYNQLQTEIEKRNWALNKLHQ